MQHFLLSPQNIKITRKPSQLTIKMTKAHQNFVIKHTKIYKLNTY